MRAAMQLAMLCIAVWSARALDTCTDGATCGVYTKDEYDVSFDTLLKGIPMLEELPPVEAPDLNWAIHVLQRLSVLVKSYFDKEQDAMAEALTPEVMVAASQKDVDKVFAEFDAFLKTSIEKLDAPILTLHRHLQTSVKKLKDVLGFGPDTSPDAPKAIHAPKADSRLATIIKRVIERLLDVILTIFVAPKGARPDTVAEYDELFKCLAGKLDNVPPPSMGELPYDQAFARYRLAGYVPYMLRKATKKLLLDMNFNQYRGASTDLLARVQDALSEDRLYAVDYAPILAPLQRGKGKYLASPVALFEIPEDTMVKKREGIAVMCIQVLKGKTGTIFTPAEDEWVWKYAKLVFNAMEADYHEGFAHLAETHLVVEAIALSLKRSAATKHAVRVLMEPHFEGTLFINWLAEKTLIKDGGPVDLTISASIQSVRAYISEVVLAKLQTNLTFPATIESAGLTEAEFPVPYYPYREFGYKVWNPLRKFVSRYLRAYYKSDAELDADADMQEFRKELAANKVEWAAANWKSGTGSLGFLTDLLASCIFIGSAQHAVVNFAQGTIMSMPNIAPQAIYSKPAESADDVRFEEDVLNALPPLRQAYLQRDVMMTLSYHHTNLVSGYADTSFEGEALIAANDFYKELKAAEDYMMNRNAEFVSAWSGVRDIPEALKKNWGYVMLYPSMIPMSINI